MVAVAARQWWVLVLQGILGIVFGAIAIAVPDIALVTLAYLFAIWAIVAGLTQIGVGWRIAEHRGRAWPFAVTGVISVIAGLLAAFIPGPTVLFLILLLGWWLAFQGVLEIYAAWRIRREITGEWLMALGGVARLAVGLVVLAMPIVGAILTVALIATFSIIGGITALLVGLRLRRFGAPGGTRNAPLMGRA
jgi:uncharacterized membrane protein HdeD (DUF308 family)